MTRCKALLALAAWPVLVGAMLLSGGCGPTYQPTARSDWQPDGRQDVMAACPVCHYATHAADSEQTQECVPCAASWAEEHGAECAWVRPLNSPAFNVCPED